MEDLYSIVSLSVGIGIGIGGIIVVIATLITGWMNNRHAERMAKLSFQAVVEQEDRQWNREQQKLKFERQRDAFRQLLFVRGIVKRNIIRDVSKHETRLIEREKSAIDLPVGIENQFEGILQKKESESEFINDPFAIKLRDLLAELEKGI